MDLVRRLAFNIVRAERSKKSIKTARKAAGSNPAFLASLLQPQIRLPGLVAVFPEPPLFTNLSFDLGV